MLGTLQAVLAPSCSHFILWLFQTKVTVSPSVTISQRLGVLIKPSAETHTYTHKHSAFHPNEAKFELSAINAFSSRWAFHEVIISILPKITDYITQNNQERPVLSFPYFCSSCVNLYLLLWKMTNLPSDQNVNKVTVSEMDLWLSPQGRTWGYIDISQYSTVSPTFTNSISTLRAINHPEITSHIGSLGYDRFVLTALSER